jgi:hypothetical protein
MGFPFLPIGTPDCCSVLTKLLAPFDAVVYLADMPFFLGELFESSPLSRLDFLFGNVLAKDYVVVLAETGIVKLALTSTPLISLASSF